MVSFFFLHLLLLLFSSKPPSAAGLSVAPDGRGDKLQTGHAQLMHREQRTERTPPPPTPPDERSRSQSRPVRQSEKGVSLHELKIEKDINSSVTLLDNFTAYPSEASNNSRSAKSGAMASNGLVNISEVTNDTRASKEQGMRSESWRMMTPYMGFAGGKWTGLPYLSVVSCFQQVADAMLAMMNRIPTHVWNMIVATVFPPLLLVVLLSVMIVVDNFWQTLTQSEGFVMEDGRIHFRRRRSPHGVSMETVRPEPPWDLARDMTFPPHHCASKAA